MPCSVCPSRPTFAAGASRRTQPPACGERALSTGQFLLGADAVPDLPSLMRSRPHSQGAVVPGGAVVSTARRSRPAAPAGRCSRRRTAPRPAPRRSRPCRPGTSGRADPSRTARCGPNACPSSPAARCRRRRPRPAACPRTRRAPPGSVGGQAISTMPAHLVERAGCRRPPPCPRACTVTSISPPSGPMISDASAGVGCGSGRAHVGRVMDEGPERP